MKYFFVLFILVFFSLGFNPHILALRDSNENFKSINKGNFFANDLKNYKDELDSQINNFKKNEELPNEVDFQLKELNDLLNIVRDTQNAQKDELMKFSNSLEQTKLSLLKMLSEYENRIDQLEYDIMEIKKFDPYIEKFNYPISKYWLKIDFNNLKSYWKFQKNKNYISIIQEIDSISLKKPSTILLLKHHKLMDGYINVDLLEKPSNLSKINQSSSGIIFNFINAQNYRFIELSFLNNQSLIIVNEVVNDSYKKIISKSVEAVENEFNSLTCEFLDRKINIFFNYKKIIEINVTNSDAKNTIGLFTKIGTSAFKNILSGNIYFEKHLKHKLLNSDDKDISKIILNDSYRFSKKISRDDLSVYRIPYANKDYDNHADEEIYNVYPVPDSNSYYEEKNVTFDNLNKDDIEQKKEELCNNYSNNEFYLNEWLSNNTLYNWRVDNEFGINRVSVLGDYKNSISKASLVYRYSSCNSVNLSAYVKLEYNSEAGLLFRYDNRENMYIVTISTKNKEIILKKYKNNKETVIRSEYIKNINSFQRHHILIYDEGEKGNINIFLDDSKIFFINNEPYYKSGLFGFYVEYGYSTFDTFKIYKKEEKKN
ncbi:conserved Plasmodium protein, unknown function [Plasmodium gallinaceum]|uniref:Uncharacterized protein n=1 Tax=Plasmodium gallinaceum TaxID=5849 RepID=A0A1J1GYL3_PLAGA|nr:conserved Plasmodium protein, unknown function [Plasmodium gallinaceum]CRG97557.1 conserved Plasmodium protein, unknown function [Plasmodium gallinaceum]